LQPVNTVVQDPENSEINKMHRTFEMPPFTQWLLMRISLSSSDSNRILVEY